MIRRRIDLEIHKAKLDDYSLKNTIKEAIREQKEKEVIRRKRRLQSFGRMR